MVCVWRAGDDVCLGVGNVGDILVKDSQNTLAQIL